MDPDASQEQTLPRKLTQQKWQLLQNPRKVSEQQKERPEAVTIIGRKGLETMLLQKYGVYDVKLRCSFFPQTLFLCLGPMSVSPKGTLGSAQELQ